MTRLLLFFILFFASADIIIAQTDNIVLKDLTWDKTVPAGMLELEIPSGSSQLPAMMYTPNGKEKHPTLILLHGMPGNEKSLDIAQVVRAHGWNVIYFNYRGSWGTSGKFDFKNCVEDTKNVVSFCNKYQDSLRIDTKNIVLFGHSMGGFVCLKVLEQLPQIKKGFALSAGDPYYDLKTFPDEKALIATVIKYPKYKSLNSTTLEIYLSAYRELPFYNLETDVKALKDKQIIMLDEQQWNKELAATIKSQNPKYFDYQVWDTDHSFTNKRASLINLVLSFLDK